MHQPTIHVSTSDDPKFDFLLRRNYLREYSTEVDKARVRRNLGIPDEYSFTWGNISGILENQEDLMTLINQITYNNTTKSKQFESDIAQLNSSVVGITNTITSNSTSCNKRVDNLLSQINEIKTDVAQNAALIKTLSGGSADFSKYVTYEYINNQGFITQAQANNLNYVKPSDLSVYATEEFVRTQIQNALASDTLTSISCEDIQFNKNGTGALRVIGTFTKSGTRELTYSEYTCTGYDETLISISNGVITATGTGNTTITISSGTVQSINVSVTITSSETVAKKQFIGFGLSYNESYQASKDSGITDINGIWNTSNIPCLDTYENGTELSIYIITTQTIVSVVEIGNVSYGTVATNVNFLNNGDLYSIYKINGDPFAYPVTQYNTSYTITAH